MIELITTHLSIDAANAPTLRSVSLILRSGELIALLGPNGAGKTTLLRTALGLLQPTSGTSTIGGKDVMTLEPIERARRISYLPQIRPLAWPITVHDVVALGRYSHGASIGRLGVEDQAAVTRAIDACDLTRLSSRRTDTLSGGELARVHCARAIAAEAPLLIADEPVASLDPRHQHRVMTFIRNYVDAGGGALVVLHDIPLASKFADRLVWMKDGAVVADGAPHDTLTPERMKEIYGVLARISTDERGMNVTIDGPA